MIDLFFESLDLPCIESKIGGGTENSFQYILKKFGVGFDYKRVLKN